MPSHSPPPPTSPRVKRQRHSSEDETSPVSTAGPEPSVLPADAPADGGSPGKVGQSSNFRNVSACNRCRLRKNRCDQNLPSCSSCAKVGVACIGYDPITKKEIPRSYVFYLETRVEQLEAILSSKGISIPPAENLDFCSRAGPDGPGLRSPTETRFSAASEGGDRTPSRSTSLLEMAKTKKQAPQGPRILNIVSPTKPGSLASASGVSFNHIVFAALQHSASDQNGSAGDKAAGPGRVGTAAVAVSGATSMRDSFFGLHATPTIKPAPFPARDVAAKLVTLFFEHANPQIPILHRAEFAHMFEQAYAPAGAGPAARGPRELYMLNMVFAIGCGVIVGEPVRAGGGGGDGAAAAARMASDGDRRGQAQPEEYYASAMMHMEACFKNCGGGLEVLQAILLLANFALLRPSPPGLWYIIGVAVRLAVDLGLHHEDPSDIDATDPASDDSKDSKSLSEAKPSPEPHLAHKRHRLWVRDMKRRLWWCTYSFDRLVSTCVGRPFGVSDQVITTEFPSPLDDKYITHGGLLEPPPDVTEPSYKNVAYHYFRLRLLQSEILQVLQWKQIQLARAGGQPLDNLQVQATMPSPFLARGFESFRSWRVDVDRRLFEWKARAPTRAETGVAFSTEFLELNYWQAVVLLYRQSMREPAVFETEYNPGKEVGSPTVFAAELREDEDRVSLKIAEAGQRIVRLYRQLHLSGLVSYTYLSTHHLFMAGIAYLYAIWNSPIVRSRLTMDEVDFTVLAAKSVFTDLMDKCPPAETCRDAFDRTAKATIKMASSCGGFGPGAMGASSRAAGGGDAKPEWGLPDEAGRGGRLPAPPSGGFFDLPLGAADLASPAVSTLDLAQTPGQQAAYEFANALRPNRAAAASPGASEVGLSAGEAAGLDSLMPRSPNAAAAARRVATAPAGGPGGFLSPAGPGPVAYPDLPGMEFLQVPVGDFGGLEQLDLGLGINWDGTQHDFGDGQQVNLFDGFFFGGQQGGVGGGMGGGL